MTSANPAASAVPFERMASAVRFLAADAVQKANSGHPGMPLGMADVATVLFTRFLRFDPADPAWPDRDRFVLSAGHGSALLYALLYLTGYPGVTIEEIESFRQMGSIAAGHPEYGRMAGVETTTGPLGQGIATAVGMALAERMLNARFGDAAVGHHTYAICGDGCLMEGLSQEAISIAGHLKLARLIVLWDDNRITIDGATNLATSDDQLARFAASGWAAERVDGHDPEAVAAAIARARASGKPSLIACRTVIGKGAPGLEGTAKVHGAPLGEAAIAAMRKTMNWPYPPFEIPAEILAAWRAAGARGASDRAAWTARMAALPAAETAEFRRRISRTLPEGWEAALAAHVSALVAARPKIATRKAGQDVIAVLARAIPELVGGSADLTGSNLTRAKDQADVSADNYGGSYVHWGIREHGMAAAINGLALHGGIVPYGGTFLVFSDYMRPSLRLAALMGLPVIQVLTHDSIGLGEDGPTHQPVEQLAALRAIPNLLVMRPADAVETAECWAAALKQANRPSVLALSRQNLPAVRTAESAENLCARGGYVLFEPDSPRAATLIATGSEVALVLEAARALTAEGIPAAAVSLPCWELFDEQPEAYRAAVLGTAGLRMAVEAASPMGWERYVAGGPILGIPGFGLSAPAPELFAHFGFTVDNVVATVKDRL